MYAKNHRDISKTLAYNLWVEPIVALVGLAAVSYLRTYKRKSKKVIGDFLQEKTDYKGETREIRKSRAE